MGPGRQRARQATPMPSLPPSLLPWFLLLLLLLLVLHAPSTYADEDDYRFLPTPKGGGQDVSYYVNAACRSGSRVYVGGGFNLVGDEVAFNFGYFEAGAGDGNSTWTSPPVTIGPDPMGLLYNDAALRSADCQGKVLTLLCPPPLPDGSTVVIIGGDFTKGGLRLGGAGGIPFVGADGARVLNHLAIYRVEPNPVLDSEASNLCPVLQGTLLPPSLNSSLHTSSSSTPEDQYAKVRCSPPGTPASAFSPGVLLTEDPYRKMTGPLESTSSGYVSSLACLNEACTEIVVGGNFNSILGTTAFSVAQLTFDDHFYMAESRALHEVEEGEGGREGGREEGGVGSTMPDDGDSCLPSRAMGTFLDPLPGVNGAVHALVSLDSRYVAVGGSFDRAGAINTPNIVLWDRVANSLVCLGHEADASSSLPPSAGGSCFSPSFCCQGFPGDIRVLLPVSPHRLLLGGSFADASSPYGIVSANLALLDFDLTAAGDGTGRQVLDPKNWRRVPVVEGGEGGGEGGRDVGTNGPVTSMVCVEEEEEEEGRCVRVLVGGWFDGLEGFGWDGGRGLTSFNATPWGLLALPLATLSLPGASSNNVHSPAVLQALNVSIVNSTTEDGVPPTPPPTPSPLPPLPPSPPGLWTRPVVGINTLLRIPYFFNSASSSSSSIISSSSSSSSSSGDGGRGAILLGGKVTELGNVAALQLPEQQQQQEGVARSLIIMTHADKDGGGEGPLCWESESEGLLRSEVLGLPVGGHGASMSFCCFVGSLCPFEGVAVACPFSGGYFCSPNMTRPMCCEEGTYCPGPGEVVKCETGGYCPLGSNEMVPCTWWMWCKREGLGRPDKIAAGVVALIVVFGAFVVLVSLNKMFLKCRGYHRQVRDNDRRKRGLLTSRGTHTVQQQQQELQEPLLLGSGGGGGKAAAAAAAASSSSSSSSSSRPITGTAVSAAVVGGESNNKTTVTPRRAFKRLAGEEGPRPSMGGGGGGGGGGGREGGRASTAGPLLRQRHKVDRIDLQFRDLTVELPGGRRKVLNGVTGGFRSGRVTAVMGPSGCGKTTLISALSNRLGLGTKVTGRTFINGSPESSTALHDVMGFVPQDDIMYEDLTVRENLLYCCQLRADPSMSRAEQRQHVDRVIDSLGLFPSRHSMIGSTEDRGISGGQRKRVNVAMELTSKPLLLFLDEPTSGLVSTFPAFFLLPSLPHHEERL